MLFNGYDRGGTARRCWSLPEGPAVCYHFLTVPQFNIWGIQSNWLRDSDFKPKTKTLDEVTFQLVQITDNTGAFLKFERQLTWPCRDCSVRGSSFCSTLTDQAAADLPAPKYQIPQIFFNADKNTVIQESGTQFLPGPYVLCQGWAYRFFKFPDGRRQILSVLIPGDLFSAFSLFNPQTNFSVQAATDVNICQLGSECIKKELAENPEVCEAFGSLCSTEVEEMAATSVNLTEPDATTRVAGFILRLVQRLSARGIRNRADAYPFPLTHLEIADATGLAPDDVNRAIHDLHADRFIALSNGEITILNHAKFENPALVTIR